MRSVWWEIVDVDMRIYHTIMSDGQPNSQSHRVCLSLSVCKPLEYVGEGGRADGMSYHNK